MPDMRQSGERVIQHQTPKNMAAEKIKVFSDLHVYKFMGRKCQCKPLETGFSHLYFNSVAKLRGGAVVRVCFFLLSSPTKQGSCDVIMHAVRIWGQVSSRQGVSECATCDRKRGVAKGENPKECNDCTSFTDVLCQDWAAICTTLT